MSEMLDKLREIGAQKIYEDTHIPVEHVQAMLHESFDGFSKVQFLGFISILEREYSKDLSELRAKGLVHFDDELPLQTENSVFVDPMNKRNMTPLYLLLAALVFAVAVYYSMETSSQESKVVQTVDNSIIEDAQKNIIEVDTNETNQSLESIDSNTSLVLVEDTNETLVEEVVEPTLSIVAKSKVWLGYVDVKTNRHHTKTFKGEFTLDATKEWLFVFGHGYVDIIVNGEVQKFSSKENVRFLYKDGVISTLTKREFKTLNRGRLW